MNALLALGAPLVGGSFPGGPGVDDIAYGASETVVAFAVLAASLGCARVARRGAFVPAITCFGLAVAALAGLVLIPRLGFQGAALSAVLGAAPIVVARGRAPLRGETPRSAAEATPPASVMAEPASARARWRLVIVGSRANARVLGQTLLRDRGAGRPRRPHLSLVDGARVDGHLVECLHRKKPDEVYFDLGAGIDEQDMARAGARMLMDGVAVHFILPRLGAPAVRAEAVHVGDHSLISLHPVRDDAVGGAIRRIVDVLGAGVALLVVSPLLALLTALVWWKMGRPIFFAQQRIGQSGRLFRLYKFRSMVQGADEILHRDPETHRRYIDSNFKLPEAEDPRVTPLGRFLRRTSLDELPQFWNVLRGDMSLVGPRAIVPEELPSYGEYARMLLRIKPGLTGLWQVSGRNTIGYPERARIDLHYIQGRTLRQDLELLVRTLPAVIRQRGVL